MEHPILEDKTAIVTGSGRGIGRAIAVEFANHGANVVVTARTRDEIEATAQTIRDETPGSATSISGDITNPDHIDRLFDQTKTEFGELDILVNNAGIGFPFDVMEDSMADFSELMDVDLHAAMDSALHAAREFRLDGDEPDEISGANGKILNISSLASQFGGSATHYSIVKAGMEAMTRALAVELAPHDVLVNAIAPGFIETAMPVVRDGEITVPDQFDPDEVQEYYFERGRIPQARLGQPDAIARRARFIVSPENTYITGQTIFVDGGMSIAQ